MTEAGDCESGIWECFDFGLRIADFGLIKGMLSILIFDYRIVLQVSYCAPCNTHRVPRISGRTYRNPKSQIHF
jgi:hypothetical protein